ncbi:MAG: hypothetical protein ACP5PS_09995 [Bacteroidales bacterium]
MADLMVTFLDQTLNNPFVLEIEPFASPASLPFAEKYGAILISAFPYEMMDVEGKFATLADEYLENISLWRKSVDIPIIASLDGTIAHAMEEYCDKIEQAGAHALQLRLFFFPDDRDFRSADYEKIFLEAVAKITYSIRIPLLINLPINFTNLFSMVEQLFYRGIQGFCLSNQQIITDIDLEQFDLIPTYGKTAELCSLFYLKWMGYLSSYFPKAHFAIRLNPSFQSDESIKYILSGAHAAIINSSDEQSRNIEA